MNHFSQFNGSLKKQKSQEIVETHFEQFQFNTADFFSEQRFGYYSLFCSRLDLIQWSSRKGRLIYEGRKYQVISHLDD